MTTSKITTRSQPPNRTRRAFVFRGGPALTAPEVGVLRVFCAAGVLPRYLTDELPGSPIRMTAPSGVPIETEHADPVEHPHQPVPADMTGHSG